MTDRCRLRLLLHHEKGKGRGKYELGRLHPMMVRATRATYGMNTLPMRREIQSLTSGEDMDEMGDMKGIG